LQQITDAIHIINSRLPDQIAITFTEQEVKCLVYKEAVQATEDSYILRQETIRLNRRVLGNLMNMVSNVNYAAANSQ
jgi:hypothetical protein